MKLKSYKSNHKQTLLMKVNKITKDQRRKIMVIIGIIINLIIIDISKESIIKIIEIIQDTMIIEIGMKIEELIQKMTRQNSQMEEDKIIITKKIILITIEIIKKEEKMMILMIMLEETIMIIQISKNTARKKKKKI